MNKMLIVAGTLILAAATNSAIAQPWRGHDRGYGYYGGAGSYRDYVRQLRACQRHARLHEELDAEHAEEHDEGLEGPGDHGDLHDALGDAHEQYHEDHPRADICDAMGYGSRYGAPTGYGHGYGYAPGYDPNYGNGYSFGFGFGR